LSAEIRFADVLTQEERESLFDWGEMIFGIEDSAFRWRSKELHFITEEGGRALSHVGLVKTKVTAGGREVTVAGVGAVVTRPEAQGRRLVHAAMSEAARYIRAEMGVEFGMLFCLPRLAPFYERQGWQLIEDEVEIDQPDGPVVWPYRVMVLPCGERTWPAGRIEVGGLPW
jgi:predicted N-acetyltransferase YhbS